MPVRDNLTKVLKDLILPELQGLRAEVSKVVMRLDVVETRLADFSARFQAIDQHLVDQSRRIDESRIEMMARIDEIRVELSGRIDQQTARIDQQTARIDQLMAQQGTLLHEVAALRQDREVLGDLLRRVGRLEEHAAA